MIFCPFPVFRLVRLYKLIFEPLRKLNFIILAIVRTSSPSLKFLIKHCQVRRMTDRFIRANVLTKHRPVCLLKCVTNIDADTRNVCLASSSPHQSSNQPQRRSLIISTILCCFGFNSSDSRLFAFMTIVETIFGGCFAANIDE